MKKERQLVKLSLIDLNEGQVDWLPKNPRQWTKQGIDNTAASIERDPDFLEDRPLLLIHNGARFVVFGGNLRSQGCKKAGHDIVPAYIYTPETDEDRMTIKRRAMLDNGSFGAWDFDELANNWSDLPLTDWGVPAWEEKHLEETEQEAVEDDFDETADQVETRCQKGDIWKLGEHRLMCGDSTSETDVAELMDGELADLWLTDPPYNVALGYKDSASEARQRHRRTDQKVILNDSMPDTAFREFLDKAYSVAKQNMKDGAAYYIFHADNESYNFRGALRDVGGMQLRQTLIWVKDTLTLGRSDYQWRHEPCLYGWKEGKSHKFFNDRKQTTCLEFARPKKSEEHPTMKPVPLIAYLMKNSTDRGDLVLDSFGGSGTTLIAAEQLERKAYLIELDPHYCDVIIARWEKLTGKTAEKI